MWVGGNGWLFTEAALEWSFFKFDLEAMYDVQVGTDG
jgi:hypothetical protein